MEACQKPENIYLVALIEGQIVGYCGMWTVMEEGNITNMAVACSHRKKRNCFFVNERDGTHCCSKGIIAFFLKCEKVM